MSEGPTDRGGAEHEPHSMSAPDERLAYEFTPERLRSMNRHFWVSANGARPLFRLYGTIEALGTENLKPDGALIVAPLHMSLADPVLTGLSLYGAGRPPHFLAKSTLFSGPLGVILKGMGHIPVLRNSAAAGESLVYAKRALDAGRTVVIFPRGTLTADPEGWPDPSRTGAARLAVETGVPIVPAAHWGLQDVLTKGSKRVVPHPRRRLRVLYGKRLDPADYPDGNAGIVRLTHRITHDTAELLAQLRGVPMPQRFVDLIDPA